MLIFFALKKSIPTYYFALSLPPDYQDIYINISAVKPEVSHPIKF